MGSSRKQGRRSAQSTGRNANSGRRTTGKRRAGYNPDTDDRYNYVDRDIYSSSASRRRNRNKKSKKGGCAKKFFGTVLVFLLLIVTVGFFYFHVLSSRLNRSEAVNSGTLASYVQQPSAAPAWDVKTENGVMNILLLGVDENKDGSDGRSDTNMLMSIDGKNKTIRLVSFLRDSYLEIPTVGKNRLNAAYAKGGVALTMQTLENNYRVNIDKFISVNFDNFSAAIDKMGGLDVPMTAAACKAENDNMGSHLKPGVNHLNGKLCLYYARIRHATDKFGHDDYGRTSRQRQVVQLLLQKAKSLNPIEANKILYDYLPFVNTNLSDSELLYLASVGAGLSGYKTETLQMPAPNTFDDSKKIHSRSVIILDLKKNCSVLRKFLYGGSDSSGG